MKIGHCISLALVEPTDGVNEVGKERTIDLLLAKRMVKKFAKKKGDGRLAGIHRQRVKRIKQASFGDTTKLGGIFSLGLQLEQGKGMKKRVTNTGVTRARYF